MDQPPGFVIKGELRVRVCKLNKIIYGLKQSPKAWFDKSSPILLSFSFRRWNFDNSVFVLKKDTGMVVPIIYMDDIIVFGSDVTSIEEVKGYLKKIF